MVSWLVLSWALSFGYVPEQFNAVDYSYQEVGMESMSTVMKIGLDANLFNRVTIFTDVENFQTPIKKSVAPAFDPYRIDYTIGARLRISDSVSITAVHECDHPVSSTMNVKTGQYYMAETKIFAEIHGKTVF